MENTCSHLRPKDGPLIDVFGQAKLRSGLAANAAMQAFFLGGKKHSFPNWLFNIAMKVMIQLSSFMDDKHYDLPLQNADFP